MTSDDDVISRKAALAEVETWRKTGGSHVIAFHHVVSLIESLPAAAPPVTQWTREKIDAVIEKIKADRNYEGFEGSRGGGQERAMFALRDALLLAQESEQ